MRNRFKGLDLIDRVPDELWTEVRDTVQETWIKTIPMEKKCIKAKWLSEETLQIAETLKKRSERQRRKGMIYPFEYRVPKNSKERYYLSLRDRDKKAFLSDQCKEIEENNRMGTTLQEN